MSHRSRSALVLVAVGALTALTALTAAPAAAGNYAAVDYSAGLDEPPIAGEERELRFVLLQHGVTPVDAGGVTVTAVLPGTAEAISVAATSLGDGAWTATLTFPTAGEWQLRVTHSEFETPQAVAVAVGEAGITRTAVAPVTGLVAIGLFLFAVSALLARRSRRLASAPPTAGPIEPIGG